MLMNDDNFIKKVNINSLLNLSPYVKKLSEIPFNDKPFKIRLFNYFFNKDHIYFKSKFNNNNIIVLSHNDLIGNLKYNFYPFNHLDKKIQKYNAYVVVNYNTQLMGFPIIGYYYDKSSILTLHSSPDIKTLYNAYMNDSEVALLNMTRLMKITDITAKSIFDEIRIIYNKGLKTWNIS